MATIFTRIANGEIPSYKCAESEDFYAFPNANHGNDTAIAATKITVADGLASVDDSVVFELIEN